MQTCSQSPDPRAPQSLADMGRRLRILLGWLVLVIALVAHEPLGSTRPQPSVRWLVLRVAEALVLGAVTFVVLALRDARNASRAPTTQAAPVEGATGLWRRARRYLDPRLFPPAVDREKWERVSEDLRSRTEKWPLALDGAALDDASARQQISLGRDRIAASGVYSLAVGSAWLLWSSFLHPSGDDGALRLALEGLVLVSAIWLTSLVVVKSREATGYALGTPGSLWESVLLMLIWLGASAAVEYARRLTWDQGAMDYYLLLPLPVGYFAIWGTRRVIWDSRSHTSLDVGFLRPLILAYHYLLPQRDGDGHEREPGSEQLCRYSLHLTQARVNLTKCLAHVNPELAGSVEFRASVRSIDALLDRSATQALMATARTVGRLQDDTAWVICCYLAWRLGDVTGAAAAETPAPVPATLPSRIDVDSGVGDATGTSATV